MPYSLDLFLALFLQLYQVLILEPISTLVLPILLTNSFAIVRKQPIIALNFESETVLRFYNLEARSPGVPSLGVEGRELPLTAVVLRQFPSCHFGPSWSPPSMISLYITCCSDCTNRAHTDKSV